MTDNEFTKRSLITATLTAVATVIATLLLMSFTGIINRKKTIDDQLQKKADIEYVEKELELKVDDDVFKEHVREGAKMQQLLLDEIRLNRSEIRQLSK